MNYSSIEQVIAALGKHTENAEVISLMNILKISEPDLKQSHVELNDYKFWADPNNELKLEFQDVGSLADIPYHDIGDGPWVLMDAIFWSDTNKNTKQSYGGSLPYGIKFSMSKKEVQALISEPRIIDNEQVDAWNKGNFELVLNYDNKTKKIRSISLSLPPTISD